MLLAVAPAPAQAPGLQENQLTVGDRQRCYFVHTPTGYTSGKRYPVVIVLHGAAANANLIEKVSHMSEVADANGFIAVYPNGVNKFGGKGFASWNGGDCCGYAVKKKIDDVGFLKALIAQLQADYSVDPASIYVVGFSNGGMLAYDAAAQLQDKVAALGIIEGSMTGKEARPTLPMPIAIFHGTEDKRVPYTGGAGKYARIGLPVNDKPVGFAVKFWCDVNGCAAQPTQTRVDGVLQEVHRDAAGKPLVILYTIEGGGHAWAGGKRSRAWGAKPTKSIDASAELWKFFQQQHR